MSYLFDDASSEFMRYGSAVVSAAPLTMACWFKGDDLTADSCALSITDKDTNVDYFGLFVRKTDTYANKVEYGARSAAGGSPTAATTTAWSANTWHHVCGVEISTASRAVYIDGGSKGTETTDITPLNLDRTTVGVLDRLSPVLYASGRIDHVSIWNVALTDAEVAQLAAGASPLLIRPTGLVAYWMLVGGVLVDVIGGVTLTNNGAAVDPDHSPLWYPQASDTWHAAAGAAGGLLRHYGMTGNMQQLVGGLRG